METGLGHKFVKRGCRKSAELTRSSVSHLIFLPSLSVEGALIKFHRPPVLVNDQYVRSRQSERERERECVSN